MQLEIPETLGRELATESAATGLSPEELLRRAWDLYRQAGRNIDPQFLGAVAALFTDPHDPKDRLLCHTIRQVIEIRNKHE